MHRLFAWSARLLIVVVVIVATGCAKKAIDSATGDPGATSNGVAGLQGSAGSMLAYEHEVDIELPGTDVFARAGEVQDACEAQTHGQCSLLSLQTSGGEPVSAVVVLRAEPSAITPLLAAAGAGGRVTARRTRAEDLATAVASTSERRSYLTTLRSELTGMAARKDLTVADRITLIDRTAQIDTELQRLDDQQAEHLRRIETNRLTLSLRAPYERTPASFSFGDLWFDIRDAFHEGIGIAVGTLAVGLPILLAAFPLLLLFRWAWRKVTGTASRDVPARMP